MDELIALLNEKQLTISTCESLTGGLFASKIVEVSGASKVYLGSIISYATKVKEDIVHVDKEIIDTKGVISSEVAYEMAKNVSKIMNTSIGISFTGNAGPNAMENKPSGLIYSCIWYDGKGYIYEDLLTGTRNEIRNEIVELMIKRLMSLIG